MGRVHFRDLLQRLNRRNPAEVTFLMVLVLEQVATHDSPGVSNRYVAKPSMRRLTALGLDQKNGLNPLNAVALQIARTKSIKRPNKQSQCCNIDKLLSCWIMPHPAELGRTFQA
jgi:hypothetical protein